MSAKFLLVALALSSVAWCDKHHPDIPKKFQKQANPDEFEANYWREGAHNLLKTKVEEELNTNTAKNIILFIGDGMSLQTVAATRVHAGKDESYNLSFDKFPGFGYSKTYCVNRQVPDSAATATAFLTGVKVNYGTVGLDSNIQRYDCEGQSQEEFHTTNIAQWAIDAGKAVGFVTTTKITHATPAPMYAHSANRYWENDQEVQNLCDPDIVDDIAEQFVYSKLAQKFKVALGGGRGCFLNETVQDEEGQWGLRADGKNLIKEWEEIHKEMGQTKYVWNREQLMSANAENTDYLLGMFDTGYVKYDYEAAQDPLEPSLSDMVEVAIRILSKEENGFFLFVEGGRIDTAHHDEFARIALDETKAFSSSIALAQSLTDERETLIVVSADHAHTLTINGYPTRGNDILGIGDYSDEDGLPYTTLSYINGEGHAITYKADNDRFDITGTDFENPEHKYYAAVPLDTESHGGDDVGVHANGPWYHLFSGSYEQNAIPYLMAYAAKIGPYAKGAAATISLGASMVALCLFSVLRQTL